MKANLRSTSKNVLGRPLELCCHNPVTGFFRDGFCHTNNQDLGKHWVCAIVTEEFLAFSFSRGNDLSTPRPEYNFPGLKDGDGWCLCAERWKEAYEAGVAPMIKLGSTHENTLNIISINILREFAVD